MENDILYPLRRLHGAMYEWNLKRKRKREIKKDISEFKKKKRQNPNTVFLVFTPEHQNLGDHAIACAEIEMLKKAGFDYVEITGAKLYRMAAYQMLDVMNGYPILVQGGGNLGTLWFDVEQIFRAIIQKNPDSKIFCYPNTMYYEDSQWGREEFERSKVIYRGHNQLYLYARERTSFDAMNAAYRNVKLIPDVVLSLNKCEAGALRKGCLVCLRSDCEKTRTGVEEACLIEQIQHIFGKDYHFSDMCTGYDIPVNQRETELERKFDEFRHAELVITDRLHGMIFAAVTGTPCIVINSKSPKVRGCYQWIKDLEYIRFADHVEDIQTLYSMIPKKEFVYDNSKLAHYYDELMKDLKDILEGKN